MSTKPSSPLLGYNNNVRHKGKVFHIQTEDSGARYGHVITHLFMDGGRILKSVKTSYGEYIGNERISEIVREMMKQQHKAMFIALRDGKFDGIAEGASEAMPMVPTAPAHSPPSPAQPWHETVGSPGDSSAVALGDALSAARGETRGATFADSEDDSEPTPIRRSPEDLALDLDALDRAAAANLAPQAMRTSSDLPPPPANLLREKTTSGKYRMAPEPKTPLPGVQSPPPGRAITHQLPVAGRQPGQLVAAPGEQRRYAPTRPASIFGQARPQQGKSIFGEDLARDKSLDEVILSYLADDVDGDEK